MTERYTCNLSSSLLAKAVEELNEPEDNVERLIAIDHIKSKFKEKYPKISLVREDDLFLLKFLRAKKFDVSKTLTMLKNYHKRNEIWPEVMDKVENPSVLSSALNQNLITKIPGGARDGSTVIVGFAGTNDVPLPDFFSCAILSTEKLIEDEQVQIHGMTIIQDLRNFGTNMMKYVGPTTTKKFLTILQEALPVRIKSLVFVNEPTIFNVIFSIISPFLKEKLRKRLKVIGGKYEALHKVINPSLLPDCYCGTGKVFEFDEYKTFLLGCETAL